MTDQIGIQWKLARVPGFGDVPHRQMASYSHWAMYTVGHNSVTMQPDWGSAASLYRLHLSAMEEYRPGWYAFRVGLIVDGCGIGNEQLPATIYLGDRTDIPTCVARFDEAFAFNDFTEPGHPELAIGTWILTGARIG